MSKRSRIVAVTAAVSAVGAVTGALCAMAALLISVPIRTGGHVPGAGAFLGAAGLGAKLGAVGAPLAGWLLLRRVPLGRALGWTSAGTVLGAVLLWGVPGAGPIIGAVLGALTAAIVLRVRHPTHPRLPGSGSGRRGPGRTGFRTGAGDGETPA
jgi:hypothetical protein